MLIWIFDGDSLASFWYPLALNGIIGVICSGNEIRAVISIVAGVSGTIVVVRIGIVSIWLIVIVIRRIVVVICFVISIFLQQYILDRQIIEFNLVYAPDHLRDNTEGVAYIPFAWKGQRTYTLN